MGSFTNCEHFPLISPCANDKGRFEVPIGKVGERGQRSVLVSTHEIDKS